MNRIWCFSEVGFLRLGEKANNHHEQKFGNSGEASPRGFGTRGDGGAQER